MFILNNEKWYIKLVSPNHPKLYRSDNSLTIGVCDDSVKTIYIANNLTPQLLKKVLCHEITHASMFSYNIDLNIDQEEILADLIATYGQEIMNITNEIFRRIKKIKMGDT